MLWIMFFENNICYQNVLNQLLTNIVTIVLANQTQSQDGQIKNLIKQLPVQAHQVIHQAPQILAKQQVLKEKTLYTLKR